MANNKVGLSYYSIDTDRYQDIRIKRLKKDFSCTGIAVYDYILCEIYRVKGCFIVWDESTVFDVAEYFGLKETTVKEIVNYCCSVGLFEKELLFSERILTSRSIQQRYTKICIAAKRKYFKIPEEYIITPEHSLNIPEKSTKTTEVCDKVKKSKEKNIPPYIPPGVKSESLEKVLSHSEIKHLLLSDETWRSETTNQSGLGIIFNEMIPGLLDDFFSYIISTGEENSIHFIKDAKRRFIYWWKYHGSKKNNSNTNGNNNRTDIKFDSKEY